MMELGHSPLLAKYRRECERAAMRETSIESRMALLRRTELSLGHPMIEASTDELRRYLEVRSHTLQPRTVYCYISHWAAFFRWAVLEEIVDKDPTMRLRRPKVRPGLPRPIASRDVKRAIDAAPTEVRAMLCLAALAGLRCMEIAGLRGVDVLRHEDPPLLVVADGKGGKPRVVPIGPEVLSALSAHGIPRSGPVFRRPDGSPLPPWKVSALGREHLHQQGIEGSMHMLRHSFATTFYRKSGKDLRMTQEMLGHSSPSTTAIYTAWDREGAAGVVNDLYDRALEAS